MKATGALLLSTLLALQGSSNLAAQQIAEDFSTNPVPAGRFIELTNGTQSSFTHQPLEQSLMAVLDVDYYEAWYLSSPPFDPLTQASNVSFSFEFRVIAADESVPPTGFVGLMTTNPVSLDGDGLTVVLSITNGIPSAVAEIDQGAANSGGDGVPLAPGTNYLVIGTYAASNRQFTVEFFSGVNFGTFVGASTNYATNGPGFIVDRFGLLNNGGTRDHFTNGSISLLIDNVYLPARRPVSITATNLIVNEGDMGTNYAVFSLMLNSPSLQPVRVDYATADITATAGSDYEAASGTALFPPGTNRTTVTVPVFGDFVAETNEVFALVLTNPVNASLAVTQVLATIRDDDRCEIWITNATSAEIPGDTNYAVFQVILTRSNSMPVTVRYATSNGTAIAAFDYLSVSGTLTFPPSITTTSIVVPILPDLLNEPDETFFVDLSYPSPTNAVFGTNRAVGNIISLIEPVTLWVEGPPTVRETDAGTTTATFTLRVSAPSALPIVASFTTLPDTATPGCDFRMTNGTVTFSPLETNRRVSVTIFGDTIYEPDESFCFAVTNVTNAILIGPNTICCVITNDDPVPTLFMADTGVVEGNAGTIPAAFRLWLSNPSYTDVTAVLATTNGNALAGSDYLGTNVVLLFAGVGTNCAIPAAATNQTLSIPVLGDVTNEADETFCLRVESLTNALVGVSQVCGVITNDDKVCLFVSDAEVIEGDGNTTDAVFKVFLDAPSFQEVTVTYYTATNGTARPIDDYVVVSNILIFPSGVTNREVVVPVVGDIRDEPDEILFLVLTNLVNGRFCGTNVATAKIIDDDPPDICVSDVSVIEGTPPGMTGTNLVFTVWLSSPGTNTITVEYRTEDGGATSKSDYYGRSGVLTFPTGAVVTNVVVPVISDTNYEADESLFFNLNNAVNARILCGQALSWIVNDDQLCFGVPPRIDVTESNCTDIQITLCEPASLPIPLTVCVTNPPRGFRFCSTNAPCCTSISSNCCLLIIQPGTLITNFQVCVDDDLIDEPHENFGLGFGFGFGGTGVGFGIPGTRYDNDPPALYLDNAGVIEGHTGTTSLCFRVRFTTRPDTNVYANVVLSDLGARLGMDYLDPFAGGPVVFTNTMTQYVCVPIVGERIFESNEVFQICLTNVLNAFVSNGCARGWITNDDLPPCVTIDDLAVWEGDTNWTPALFPVRVLGETEIPFIIGYSTSNGTAVASSDYIPTNSTLRFDPGITNASVLAWVIGDTYDESNETFTVRLTRADTNSILCRTNGTCTILDEDPPEIRVVDTAVYEGDVGTTNLTFTLTLSNAKSNEVRVSWFTRDGTAESTSDYGAASGDLTFPPGQVAQTLSIVVTNDDLTEWSEYFFLCLTNPVFGRIVTPCALGWILDDDAPCLQVNTTNGVMEGDTLTIEITLDHPSTLTGYVNYATVDATVGEAAGAGFEAATAGFDYVAQSGLLTFPPGTTNATIGLDISDDTIDETNELFYVRFSNLIALTNCGATQTVVIITSIPSPPCITITNMTVVEGNGPFTNLMFTALLSWASSRTVTVNYATADDTAGSGSDYMRTNGVLRFLPGSTNTNFAVRIYGDCSLEGTEFFRVNFTNAQFARLCTTQAIATILDDDPPPTLCFVTNLVRVGERNPDSINPVTNAVFGLWLSCSSAFTTEVAYATADGSATWGVDYLPTNGVVSFLPGQTATNIVVRVLPDYDDETDESFFVELFNPDTNRVTLCTNRATGVITNDDGIGVCITPLAATVLEPSNGTSDVQFTVTLSKPPTSPIRVDFQTVDGSATGSTNGIFGDYLKTNGAVVFAEGVTTTNLKISVFADAYDEAEEHFSVWLGSPGYTRLCTNDVPITLIDTNPPCLTIYDTNIVVTPGNNVAEVLVTLSSPFPLAITVDWFTRNGTALAGSDYDPGPGRMIFPPGTTNGSIPIRIKPNTRTEPNEYFYVVLTNPVNATFCTNTGIVNIVNTTNACPEVAVLQPPASSCLTEDDVVPILVEAGDRDGFLRQVALYAGTNKISDVQPYPPESTNRLYRVAWTAPSPGQYALNAVVEDNLNCRLTSAPVNVTVSAPALLSISDASVLEGDSGWRCADFLVTLASSNCHPISVDVLTTNDVAGLNRATNNDYQTVATNLIFQPGQTQHVVCVPIRGDLEIEPDETFLVILTNLVNATASKGIGLGTILTDDTNRPPVATILSPTNGQVFFTPPGLIPILADAQDPDGSVRDVEFYAGPNFIGVSTNRPFALEWQINVPGLHCLRAIATDNVGARATSAPVCITVRACTGTLNVAPLPDQTVCACGPATFSVAATSPDPLTYQWRFNRRLIPGATDRNLTLQSLTSAEAGQYSVEVRTPCHPSIVSTGMLAVVGENIPNPVTYSNAQPITINPYGTASPYPSSIQVQCVPGVVQKITVDIPKLTHVFVGDIDMVLLGPSGAAIKLMSDVHNATRLSVTNLSLTFDDDCPSRLPSTGLITSGCYKPTDYNGGGTEAWPAPFPASLTYVTNLTNFNGSSPNGAWGLYVVDDAELDGGFMSGGWSMTILWEDLPPRLTSPVLLPDGRTEVTLLSQAGRTHFIEASTDLICWFPVSTNVPNSAVTRIVVPAGPLCLCQRFYRVQRCPNIDKFRDDPPPRLTGAEFLGSGGMRTRIVGPPGRNCAIQISTDLCTWRCVSTHEMDGREATVLVPEVNGTKQSFIRAVILP
jgi:hypothetical protein